MKTPSCSIGPGKGLSVKPESHRRSDGPGERPVAPVGALADRWILAQLRMLRRCTATVTRPNPARAKRIIKWESGVELLL
jgi:hypothetical protein